MPRKQPAQGESQQRRELRRCEHVLRQGPRAEAGRVGGRQQHDDAESDEPLGRQRERTESSPRAYRIVPGRGRARNFANAAATAAIVPVWMTRSIAQPKRNPGERPVGLAEEDVLPARFRQHGGELRAGDRGGHRQKPGDHPDAEEQSAASEKARALGRDDEDARADHRADDQRDGVEPADAAPQRLVHQPSRNPRRRRRRRAVDRMDRASTNAATMPAPPAIRSGAAGTAAGGGGIFARSPAVAARRRASSSSRLRSPIRIAQRWFAARAEAKSGAQRAQQGFLGPHPPVVARDRPGAGLLERPLARAPRDPPRLRSRNREDGGTP